MQVFVEYALAENFCMDFMLLACAKAAAKNAASYFRIAAISALGACFAVLFPLLKLGGAAAITLKFFVGALLSLAAAKSGSVRGRIKFCTIFFAFTFLTGGALFAVFALGGVSYLKGGGYVLSPVPVGVPLLFIFVIFIAVKKLYKHAANVKSNRAKLKIYRGGNVACCGGFFDSGNCVFFKGAPVSILPDRVADKLVDREGIKTFVDIHTVSGAAKIAVFTADRVEIDDGDKTLIKRDVLFGVSQKFMVGAVLHPYLAEVN